MKQNKNKKQNNKFGNSTQRSLTDMDKLYPPLLYNLES